MTDFIFGIIAAAILIVAVLIGYQAYTAKDGCEVQYGPGWVTGAYPGNLCVGPDGAVKGKR